MGTSPNDSENENKPLKNFAKALFSVISAELDIDWDNLLECDVEVGLNRFYSVLNGTVERNVPDCKSRSNSYSIWYTNELKDVIHEKKELHKTWKDLHLPRD